MPKKAPNSGEKLRKTQRNKESANAPPKVEKQRKEYERLLMALFGREPNDTALGVLRSLSRELPKREDAVMPKLPETQSIDALQDDVHEELTNVVVTQAPLERRTSVVVSAFDPSSLRSVPAKVPESVPAESAPKPSSAPPMLPHGESAPILAQSSPSLRERLLRIFGFSRSGESFATFAGPQNPPPKTMPSQNEETERERRMLLELMAEQDALFAALADNGASARHVRTAVRDENRKIDALEGRMIPYDRDPRNKRILVAEAGRNGTEQWLVFRDNNNRLGIGFQEKEKTDTDSGEKSLA